jgi:hypothetical protein
LISETNKNDGSLPEGGIVKTIAKVVLLATVALAPAPWGGERASAQGWGPAVAAKDIDPVIRAAAEVMGMVRTRALVIGQVNLPEFVGKGTMIDLEAAAPGQPVEISRYSFAVAIHIPASRMEFEGPQTPKSIRVVKGNRAWNESWNDDKTKLGTTPSDNAAYRAQLMWLQPHAFIHAAAFASAKKCLDGKECTTPFKVAQEGGKTVIDVQINGQSYKATLGADKRPERIETMIAVPGGGSKKMAAIYSHYRTGEAPDAGFGTSFGKDALDRYHSGTYWPSHIVHEVDGKKVLDLAVTEGWANPYQVFPDPELLAKAQ